MHGEGYPVLEILEKFRALKKKTVGMPYTEKRIMDVFSVDDRAIMQMNNESPRKLLETSKVINWKFN